MTPQPCSVVGCEMPARSRGWCRKHYDRWLRHGDPTVNLNRPRPFEVRFWEKVEKTEGCWLWTAYTDRHGYGRLARPGKSDLAHRIAYELVVGSIPEGMDLDHLCRVPRCVNPLHLEPVDHRENVQRGRAGLPNRSKTHCPRGHAYDEANTYLRPGRGRVCRTCDAFHSREYRKRLAERRRRAA